MKLATILMLIALLFSGACTWVPLEQGGKQIRVAPMSESMSRCKFKGDITTAVTNRLVGVERNAIKVADELETLARNEAAGLGANVLLPKSEVIAGEQRFAAYLCP